MHIKTAVVVAAITLAAGLSACETATPYQPLARGSAVSGGFTDQRIEADRFRVTFQGNSLTSRKTVETYLLFRSAELTVAQGYDWFETVQRHTDRSQETYGEPYPYWNPYWNVWGGFGRHRHFFGGFWGDPFFNDFDYRTVERFEASSEIIVHHGPKPAEDPRAFDARSVIANLGPTIQRPVVKS